MPTLNSYFLLQSAVDAMLASLPVVLRGQVKVSKFGSVRKPTQEVDVYNVQILPKGVWAKPDRF